MEMDLHVFCLELGLLLSLYSVMLWANPVWFPPPLKIDMNVGRINEIPSNSHRCSPQLLTNATHFPFSARFSIKRARKKDSFNNPWLVGIDHGFCLCPWEGYLCRAAIISPSFCFGSFFILSPAPLRPPTGFLYAKCCPVHRSALFLPKAIMEIFFKLQGHSGCLWHTWLKLPFPLQSQNHPSANFFSWKC